MERILREYEETKRDTGYLNARSRMQYLHNKLAHIKQCILNFNQQHSQHRKGGLSAASANSINNSINNSNNRNSSSNGGRIFKKSYNNFNNNSAAATGNQ